MTLVHWLSTQWCNYSCWYCRQDHARKQTYKGSPGHWADCRPVADWAAAFDRHFWGDQLTLVVTGGEFLLDVKNARKLLFYLHDQPYFAAAHVDTNLSWDFERYEGLQDKVELVPSLHPTDMEEREFVAKLRAALARGWRVRRLNYVCTPDRVPTLARLHAEFASMGVRLNPLTAFGYVDQYSPNELAEFRRHIPKVVWPHRVNESTAGEPCLFPSLAYEMEADGSLFVGCSEELKGSIFDAELPKRPTGDVPCPHQDCFCDNKHPYMERNRGHYDLVTGAINDLSIHS